MENSAALFAALPHAPDFAYDWWALEDFACLKTLFDGMARTHQHLAWHGEDDVWTHTRMVCQALAGLPGFRALPRESARALALAALLHDIGKISCTRLEDGVLTSPRHGPVGAQEARTLLWTEFNLCGTPEAQQFREAVCMLIRYHTLPLHLFEKKNAADSARKTAAGGLAAPLFSLEALCLLGEADVLGRISSDTREKLDAVALSREAAEEGGCLAGPYPFRSARTARALFAGGSVWPDQELFDDSWGEVILMCGLPGTGKDTWIQKNHPDLPTVCLDDLRRRAGIGPEDEQGRIVQQAKEQAREYLRQKQPFVWNATCLTPQRGQLVSLFEQYGARVRIVYLETPWEENLRRNTARPNSVPESVLGRMLTKLEPPLPPEAQTVEWQCV